MFQGDMWPKSSQFLEYEVINMKKKLIQRGLLGFPLGIAIGFVITIMISVCVGDGSFYPVTLELMEAMGNELNAVIVQTVLCGIMGTGFAMASVIWEIDAWSLAKQSGIYFSVACIVMLPIAYVTNWMKHSVGGILSYIGIFFAVFLLSLMSLRRFAALSAKSKSLLIKSSTTSFAPSSFMRDDALIIGAIVKPKSFSDIS